MNITTIPWGMDAREMGATPDEKTATGYSTGPGYVIWERNSGSREGEIDVLRETTTFSFLLRCLPERAAVGTFEESLTDKKKGRLLALAQAYILPTTEPRKQAPDWRATVWVMTESHPTHNKAPAAKG